MSPSHARRSHLRTQFSHCRRLWYEEYLFSNEHSCRTAMKQGKQCIHLQQLTRVIILQAAAWMLFHSEEQHPVIKVCTAKVKACSEELATDHWMLLLTATSINAQELPETWSMSTATYLAVMPHSRSRWYRSVI